MKNNFRDPSEGLYGTYNIRSFSGLGAGVCSGLGGGSLVYANVPVRNYKRWFVKQNLSDGRFEGALHE